jgi:acyl dehydratase
MTDDRPLAELRVTFDPAAIRNYGGPSEGFHFDEQAARERNYPGLVCWGTLTMLPMWELMNRVGNFSWNDFHALSIRFLKPVIAGDEVVYTVRQRPSDPNPEQSVIFDLMAETARFGVVASGQVSASKNSA